MKHINAINPKDLSITDDPFPGRWSRGTSKYAEKFSSAKQGKRIKCPEGTAARLAAQFKKWLQAQGHKSPEVRSINCCKDGFGGVWWMEKEPASVWNGLVESKKKVKA